MGYLRALYDWPADGFDLDFRDRAAAQQIFEEGQGSLLTDGTRACMEASHNTTSCSTQRAARAGFGC